MSEWITTKPTDDEVADGTWVLATFQTGDKRRIVRSKDGYYCRKYWLEDSRLDGVVAYRTDLPEPYQPPKQPEPGEFWKPRFGSDPVRYLNTTTTDGCAVFEHRNGIVGIRKIGEFVELFVHLPDRTGWDEPEKKQKKRTHNNRERREWKNVREIHWNDEDEGMIPAQFHFIHEDGHVREVLPGDTDPDETKEFLRSMTGLLAKEGIPTPVEGYRDLSRVKTDIRRLANRTDAAKQLIEALGDYLKVASQPNWDTLVSAYKAAKESMK